jgi:hypothetical protein
VIAGLGLEYRSLHPDRKRAPAETRARNWRRNAQLCSMSDLAVRFLAGANSPPQDLILDQQFSNNFLQAGIVLKDLI